MGSVLPDLPPAPVGPAGASRGARGLRPGVSRPRSKLLPLSSGFRQGSGRARQGAALTSPEFLCPADLTFSPFCGTLFLRGPFRSHLGAAPFPGCPWTARKVRSKDRSFFMLFCGCCGKITGLIFSGSTHMRGALQCLCASVNSPEIVNPIFSPKCGGDLCPLLIL